AALGRAGRAVLGAPPGAGKTTRVPPALLASGLAGGRIVMLEPRRLAARAAAERMADTLGEPVGRTVGYRIRGEARISAATRIEVVTEGILTRMIQSDPVLGGVGALIFDEFHERSLHADLGLALAWDVRQALRDDLLLVVMSATLDTTAVAALLGEAPVIAAHGRAFPVETRWLPRPLAAGLRFETAAAAVIRQALDETGGDLLAFLPGAGEIRRVAEDLSPSLPRDCDILPLHGGMDLSAQRAALAPAGAGRRNVVLATAIAETSLTLPGVRVVVDAGRARRARFDPASGMTRLVTERVTRAEAEQRRGRAGRVGPGLCYRMWARAEEGALAPFPPPEIATADLAGLALELALWGTEGGDLGFLTPPPAAALAEARTLLAELGALDAAGAITAHGRRLAALPVHPRLAHMLAVAGPRAALLAALLEDRDPLRGGAADLDLRIAAVSQRDGAVPRAVADRIGAEARQLAAAAA
ncbi:MAG: ATP-dependent helicase HrpB, partial [Thermoleophilia bacterium]|nr:ATP-dependent helicase HrpB [Thermoleophilia bacterium]